MMAMLAGMCLVVVGCDDDENGNGPSGDLNEILLQPERLPTLKSGLVYEGWVATIDEDSNWVDSQSFGKFFWDQFNYFFLSPDDTTQVIDSLFTINGHVYDYDIIAITLERHPSDDSPDPSPTVIASSPLDPNRSTKLRFPVGFGEAGGFYMIGTFSDGNYREEEQEIENETAGIWFLEMIRSEESGEGSEVTVNEEYGVGLSLPVLPDTGYSYEGWIALDNGDTLSTGKFLFPNFQDYDNSHAAPGPIPNFPGEDFLLNPPAGVAEYPPNLLGGGTALITLEPNPDNDLLRPSNLVVLQKALITSTLRVRNASEEQMANVAVLSFPRLDVVFSSR
jgi:hypothetical protein